MNSMISSPAVVLVRHAMSLVSKELASQDWPLTTEGRREAAMLANELDLPAETHFVSSDEVKAKQTAEAFSNEILIDRRLREAGRPWVEGNYESVARRWLEGERVDGWELRSDVLRRMTGAASEAATRAGTDVCLVSHGLAISVLVADLAHVDPVEFWSQLRFPDYVKIDLRSAVASRERRGGE